MLYPTELLARTRFNPIVAIVLLGSTINFAPMTDGHDQHNETIVMDFINDPVISDADTPIVGLALEFLHSRRTGIIGPRRES